MGAAGLLLLLLVAACNGGKGGPSVLQPWEGATALTAQEDAPLGIASDGSQVFVTTGRTQVGDHAIRAVPLEAGGMSRVLVTNPGGSVPNGPLVVDGTDLYVAAGSGVVRVSVATGEAAPVVSGRPAEVTSLAVDGRYIWWTTSVFGVPAAAEVARMPKPGGAPEILAAGVDDKGGVFLRDEAARRAVAVPGASSFGSIVPDGDGAYVASPLGVYRFAAGRAPHVVASATALGGAPTRIAADAEHIYGVVAGGPNNVFTTPKANGPIRQLTGKADSTKTVAVAGGEVYFFADGALSAVAATGGPTRTIASGKQAAGDLAIVGDRVVFSAANRVWSAYRQRP